MNVIHYIGLDVHKKSISYCIKTADGRIVQEGKLQALRATLRSWAEDLREPWHGAMEATLFSAWIYDTLKPYAQRLVMGHPARMKAITRRQKEERHDRCANHRGPAAVRPVAHLLCVAAGDARSEAAAALSQYGGPAVGTHAEQDGWSVDGERHHLRQRQAAREEVLLRADEESGRGTGVSQRSAADESRLDGDVRVGPEADHPKAVVGAGFRATRRTPDEHPRSRSDHSVDLGTGGSRPTSLLLDWGCGQLLWLNLCVSILCRQRATWPNLQTKKRLAPDSTDRSGQVGATMESAAGRDCMPGNWS